VKPTVVALLGSSNFEYLVTIIALTKLGHTVLFLSTRISQPAMESLIETTGATFLLADAKSLNVAGSVKLSMPHLHIYEIAGGSVFDFPIDVHADTRMDYQLDEKLETLNNIYIIHSSGMCGAYLCGLFQWLTHLRLHWSAQTDISAPSKCDCQLCV